MRRGAITRRPHSASFQLCSSLRARHCYNYTFLLNIQGGCSCGTGVVSFAYALVRATKPSPRLMHEHVHRDNRQAAEVVLSAARVERTSVLSGFCPC